MSNQDKELFIEDPKLESNKWMLLTIILACSVFLDIATYTVQVPLLPDLQVRVFRDNYTILSAYYYSFAVSSLLCLLVIPLVGRRFTAKRIIIFTQVIFIPANILMYFTTNMYLYFLARIVMGFCSSSMWASATVLTYTSVQKCHYPTAISFIYAAESVGFLVGPFISGFLGETSFVAIAIMVTICLVLMIFLSPPQKNPMIDPTLSLMDMIREWLTSMVQAQSLLMYGVICAVSGLCAMNEICITSFYSSEFGMSERDIGLVLAGYGVAYAISAVVCGKVSRWLTFRTQLISALVVFAFVFPVLVKQDFYSLTAIVSLIMLWSCGLGFGIVVTSSSVLLTESLESNVMGVNYLNEQSITTLRLLLFLFWWYGGWFLGPLVGSAARCDDHFNLMWLYRSSGILVLLIAVVVLVFTKRSSIKNFRALSSRRTASLHVSSHTSSTRPISSHKPNYTSLDC